MQQKQAQQTKTQTPSPRPRNCQPTSEIDVSDLVERAYQEDLARKKNKSKTVPKAPLALAAAPKKARPKLPDKPAQIKPLKAKQQVQRSKTRVNLASALQEKFITRFGKKYVTMAKWLRYQTSLALCDSFSDAIREIVKELVSVGGGKIRLRNVGVLKVVKSKEHLHNNPRTGEYFCAKSQWSVRFKASDQIFRGPKKRMNKKSEKP